MGPLTEHRAKPALPFAGLYRLIDFPLSNCANSRITDVWVLQQYQPHSIEDHLANGRPWDLDRSVGGLLLLQPFTGGEEEGFAEGNADALWRHHRLVEEFGADVVLVLSADAVYTLDYRDVIDAHLAHDADVTMVTTRVDDDAGRFGVVIAGDDGRVTSFEYKPDEPQSDIVTTEVFAYRPSALLETLRSLASGDEPLEDFGHALLPRLVEDGRAYSFALEGYWRDVGTPESYWRAHQDMLDGAGLDLDDLDWRIMTRAGHRPPALIEAGATVVQSLLSPACRVAGRVMRSVLSPGVVVEAGAVVEESVILDDAVIKAGVRVHRAIVDAGVQVTERSRSIDSGTPIPIYARTETNRGL
jgi:glucose-1-phosphate adenylyltransferase